MKNIIKVFPKEKTGFYYDQYLLNGEIYIKFDDLCEPMEVLYPYTLSQKLSYYFRLIIHKMMKGIDWFFFLLGAMLFTELLHELYHYSFCGGEFIAGIGYIRGESIFGGMTFCRSSHFGGEVLPSIMEILFFIFIIGLKAKKIK